MFRPSKLHNCQRLEFALMDDILSRIVQADRPPDRRRIDALIWIKPYATGIAITDSRLPRTYTLLIPRAVLPRLFFPNSSKPLALHCHVQQLVQQDWVESAGS